MQIKNLLVSSLLTATTALAVPTHHQQGRRAEAKSMMAEAVTWTITGLSRTCDASFTTCVWAFGINNGAAVTPCTEIVTGSPPTTFANETNGGPATCGVYTVTSGWSDQFGPGNGFTTFSVVDYAAKLIVFPAYTDKQVANGTVVTPDQSYTPQSLQ